MSKESRRATRNAARTGSTGPSGTSRAGRRERIRRVEQKPFLERYRGLLLGIGAAVVIAAVVGVFFVQSTQASYSCSTLFDPAPTPSPAAGATARIGYPQDDMGQIHNVSRPQRYTFCPPASGNHLNGAGIGPITPRVFGPNDNVGPPNWIHNLEHGALVILYRGDSDGASAAGQTRFKEFFDTFPPSPICQFPPRQLSPVVARFDAMEWPFAALVWHRVLPMDQWDPALALQFYATESERTDADGVFITPPEPRCANPGSSASPGASGSPAASPSGSPAASPGGSASPSPAGSGAPSTSPAASPSPSPSG